MASPPRPLFPIAANGHADFGGITQAAFAEVLLLVGRYGTEDIFDEVQSGELEDETARWLLEKLLLPVVLHATETRAERVRRLGDFYHDLHVELDRRVEAAEAAKAAKAELEHNHPKRSGLPRLPLCLKPNEPDAERKAYAWACKQLGGGPLTMYVSRISWPRASLRW